MIDLPVGNKKAENIAYSLCDHLKLTEPGAKYQGYKILPKTVGRRDGFILESPDQQNKIYFKKDESAIEQSICLSIFAYLAKAPEPTLYLTPTDEKILGTHSLSGLIFAKVAYLKPNNF